MALMTAAEYIESLRKLNTRVYLFGEKIDNWVDHPIIRPSINCVAMTYALAQNPEYEEIMTAKSNITGKTINRLDVYKRQVLYQAGHHRRACPLPALPGRTWRHGGDDGSGQALR